MKTFGEVDEFLGLTQVAFYSLKNEPSTSLFSPGAHLHPYFRELSCLLGRAQFLVIRKNNLCSSAQSALWGSMTLKLLSTFSPSKRECFLTSYRIDLSVTSSTSKVMTHVTSRRELLENFNGVTTGTRRKPSGSTEQVLEYIWHHVGANHATWAQVRDLKM